MIMAKVDVARKAAALADSKLESIMWHLDKRGLKSGKRLQSCVVSDLKSDYKQYKAAPSREVVQGILSIGVPGLMTNSEGAFFRHFKTFLSSRDSGLEKRMSRTDILAWSAILVTWHWIGRPITMQLKIYLPPPLFSKSLTMRFLPSSYPSISEQLQKEHL